MLQNVVKYDFSRILDSAIMVKAYLWIVVVEINVLIFVLRVTSGPFH